MVSRASVDWLIPAGLVALSFIPAVAGTLRLIQLGGGAEITPESARFFAASLPVVLHILSSVLYGLLGAFQFAPGFRRRKPCWHRAAGRILIPCGIIAALSGLWMTQSYPPANFDGGFVHVMRLLAGSSMASCLCLGLAAIRRRDVPLHQAWMIRGYALGAGAGTQVLTHLPWFLFPSIHGETARAVCMGAGWAINLSVAEWLIRREKATASLRAQNSDFPGHRSIPMGQKIIQTPNAPASPFFSQGVKAGPHVYVSGMTGTDPHTKQLAGDTIQAQTRQALANCEQVLLASGVTRDDVVEVQVLLTHPQDFAGMNEAYLAFFPTNPPARSVAKLGVDLPGLLVSIRMTAYAGSNPQR
jgi:reactive intermediate/imine deaminase